MGERRADYIISQQEADDLIKMKKINADEKPYEFPRVGERISIPIVSEDGREQFILDAHRGKIALKKVTYQNRARKVIPLLRLDFGGPPHTNPDGCTIEGTHMHVYRENYGDKWAYIVPDRLKINEVEVLFDLFMDECNIIEKPLIQGSAI